MVGVQPQFFRTGTSRNTVCQIDMVVSCLHLLLGLATATPDRVKCDVPLETGQEDSMSSWAVPTTMRIYREWPDSTQLECGASYVMGKALVAHIAFEKAGDNCYILGVQGRRFDRSGCSVCVAATTRDVLAIRRSRSRRSRPGTVRRSRSRMIRPGLRRSCSSHTDLRYGCGRRESGRDTTTNPRETALASRRAGDAKSR